MTTASAILEPPVSSPRSLMEAYALLAEGGYRPLAGGTDLMVQLAAGTWPPAVAEGGEGADGGTAGAPSRLLDLWRLDELRGIDLVDGRLVIGALTTYRELRRSPLIQQHLPALAEAAASVGAAQIQNRGTIGGNIANASPAGDTLPILLATDARLEIGGPRGEREVAADGFWTAYRRTALAGDELLLRVSIPLARGRRTRFRKVGTRQAQAISKVVMALSYAEDGGVWRRVRLALGSVAPVPMRARQTEAVLEGAAPRRTSADHAAAVLAREVRPIDDVRSTADYRRAVSARILHRLLREEGDW